MSDSKTLECSGLACKRGERLLFCDVGFRLNPGDLMHLLGPNGKGKSTLIKTLCGLRRPEAGKVTWSTLDVHEEENAFGGDLLYVGHENALNLDLTPLENIRSLQALHGQPAANLKSALETAGLKGRLHLPCRRLSAGQRRRVALARLILSESVFWLLDEPAAALDVSGREWLALLLENHAREGGMALFSAHEPVISADLKELQLP